MASTRGSTTDPGPSRGSSNEAGSARGSSSDRRSRIETSPPIDHYTGTLYKALGATDWSAAERRWALAHLLIHDKDAGIVAAGSWDPVDLSRAVSGSGTRGSLSERSESKGGPLLIDARSKEYVRLIPAPDTAFSLRVVSEGDDGRRLAISHWNKHHKGVLARALVRDRPRIGGIASLLSWAQDAGVRLERVGDRELDLVV